MQRIFNLRTSLTTYLFFIVSFTYAQTDYYWVGDGGDWSDLTHWATSSGGGTLHGVLPGPTDNVYFDENSFSQPGQTVLLPNNGTTYQCLNMDWTGVTHNPHIQAEHLFVRLEIHGSLTMVDGMTKNLRGIDLLANTGTHAVTVGASTLGSNSGLNFEGSATWVLQDSVACAWIRPNNGIVQTNDQPVYTSFYIDAAEGQTGHLQAGNSIFYTVNGLDFKPSGFLFDAGTSTIILISGAIDPRFITGNGKAFYNVINTDGFSATIEGSNTFNTLTLEAGADVVFEAGQTQTVTDFVAIGTSESPISITSSDTAQQATISQLTGTVNAEYLTLQNMEGAGGATFIADNSLDFGGNSGWTINAPIVFPYYWVGNSGVWSDPMNWAQSSGGTDFHGTPPGFADNVIFDALSFDQTSVVTINSDVVVNDLSFAGIDELVTIDGINMNIDVNGSLALDEDVSIVPALNMTSGSPQNLTFNGAVFVDLIKFSGTGPWDMQDSLAAEEVIFDQGILNTNGFPLMASSGLSFSPSDEDNNYIEFNAGTSHIYTPSLDVDQFWVNAQNIGPTQVDLTSATLHLTGSNNLTFSPGGLVFNKVMVEEVAGIYDNVNVTFNSHLNDSTFVDELFIDPGANVKFNHISGMDPDTLFKFNFNTLIASGTANNPTVLSFDDPDGKALIESLSGTDFIGNYLHIQGINATGANFTADTCSVDLGNNSGWTILTCKENQTITFDSIPDKVFDDAPFVLSAIASSGLPVTYAKTGGSTLIDINNDTVTINGVGTVFITARQAGDPFYNPAADVERSFQIVKGDQTISFSQIPDKTYGDDSFDLSDFTSASSGLPLSFSVVGSGTSPVTLNGSTVTIDSVGEATIRAVQSGNENYNSAGSKDVTFSINKIAQTITFESIDSKKIGDDPFKISASSSAGLPVTFNIVSGPVSISSDTVTIEGAGTAVIEASQAGDAYHEPASAQQTITINKISQTISFNDIPDKTFGDAPFIVNAEASTGLPVTFEVVSGPVSISDDAVKIEGAGEASIRATQAGDSNYSSASVEQDFTIAKASQVITFDSLVGKTFGDHPFQLDATTSSGLDVVFTVKTGSISILGDTVTIEGAGGAVIEASQAGNDNYESASPTERTLTISKASQTITFEDIGSEVNLEDSPVTLEANSSSGLDVVFSVVSGPATVDGSQLTLTSDGNVEVAASQAGNSNYEPASNVSQTFDVITSVLGLSSYQEYVQFYPNPATDKLFVNLLDENATEVKIKFYTTAGKLVMEHLSNENSKVNIKKLTPGIYFLHVESKEKSTPIGKLIVN